MENKNKNNIANLFGWILLTAIIMVIAYFVYSKNINKMDGESPFNSQGENENTPVIEDEYEKIQYQTEGRPHFGEDSGQFEEEN